MPRSLRDAPAEAAERVAPNMNAQEVANTLNAYSTNRGLSEQTYEPEPGRIQAVKILPRRCVQTLARPGEHDH